MERLESIEQQQEDHEDRQRHDPREALHRALLSLEFARRRQTRVDPDRALVQLGQKFRPRHRGQKTGCHKAQQRAGEHGAWSLDYPGQSRRTKPFASANKAVVSVRKVLVEQQQAKQRDQRQRQHQRADEGRSHAPGHRRENAPLVTLEREDRQVRRDDDDREQRWPPDLDRGLQRCSQAGRFVLHLVFVEIAEAAMAIALHGRCERQCGSGVNAKWRACLALCSRADQQRHQRVQGPHVASH